MLLLGRETTVERSFIDALVESRRLFKDLVSVSSDFAWETDGDGRFRYVSPRGALGYTARELNGRLPYAMLAAEHGEPEIFPLDSRIPLEDAEVWLRGKNGAPACLVVSCLPVAGDESYRGTRGGCRDVTEARALDAALARAERSSRLLARVMEAIRSEIAPAAMLAAAAEATAAALGARHCWILRAGGAAFAVAARSGESPPAGAEDAIATGSAACSPGAATPVAIPGLHAALAAAAYQVRVNGAIAAARDAAGPVFDDDERGLLVQVADRLAIALEQVANTELLERLSRTDELSGLLNRRAFFDEIALRLRHQERTGRAGAPLYIDLDNFKPVNDRYGHRRGDERSAPSPPCPAGAPASATSPRASAAMSSPCGWRNRTRPLRPPRPGPCCATAARSWRPFPPVTTCAWASPSASRSAPPVRAPTLFSPAPTKPCMSPSVPERAPWRWRLLRKASDDVGQPVPAASASA